MDPAKRTQAYWEAAFREVLSPSDTTLSAKDHLLQYYTPDYSSKMDGVTTNFNRLLHNIENARKKSSSYEHKVLEFTSNEQGFTWKHRISVQENRAYILEVEGLSAVQLTDDGRIKSETGSVRVTKSKFPLVKPLIWLNRHVTSFRSLLNIE